MKNEDGYKQYGNTFDENDQSQSEVISETTSEKGHFSHVLVIVGILATILLIVGIVAMIFGFRKMEERAAEEATISVNILQNLRVNVADVTQWNRFSIVTLVPCGEDVDEPIAAFMENYNQYTKKQAEKRLVTNIQATLQDETFQKKYPEWCEPIGRALIEDCDDIDFVMTSLYDYAKAALEEGGYDYYTLDTGTYQIKVAKDSVLYQKDLNRNQVINYYVMDLIYGDELALPIEANTVRNSIQVITDSDTASIMQTMSPYVKLYVTIPKDQPIYRYYMMTDNGQVLENMTVTSAKEYVAGREVDLITTSVSVRLQSIDDNAFFIRFENTDNGDIYDYYATTEEEYQYLIDYYSENENNVYCYEFDCVEMGSVYRVIKWKNNPYDDRLQALINETQSTSVSEASGTIETIPEETIKDTVISESSDEVNISDLITEAVEIYNQIPEEEKEAFKDAIKDMYNNISDEEKVKVKDMILPDALESFSFH